MSEAGAFSVAELPKKKPKAKPYASSWSTKSIIVQMRGSEEFKQALEMLAGREGTSIAGLVESAVRAYARTIGVMEPLPKR